LAGLLVLAVGRGREIVDQMNDDEVAWVAGFVVFGKSGERAGRKLSGSGRFMARTRFR
jgi:hypothetical protein